MATTLYSPTGTKVTVLDIFAPRLIARGWTVSPPVITPPPDPPWSGAQPTLPFAQTSADADTFQFANLNVSEDVQNEDASSWPNRIELGFRRMAGAVLQARRLVTFFNEFWEIRGVPAKTTTTWFRAYVKEFAADSDHDPNIPIIEVSSNRDTRITLWGIMPNGDIARNVGTAASPVWARGTFVVVGTVDPGHGIPWLNTGA